MPNSPREAFSETFWVFGVLGSVDGRGDLKTIADGKLLPHVGGYAENDPFWAQKSALFPCENANVPHCAYSRTYEGGGLGVLLKIPGGGVFQERPENGLFKLPKHYVLKGKWPILKKK